MAEIIRKIPQEIVEQYINYSVAEVLANIINDVGYSEVDYILNDLALILDENGKVPYTEEDEAA